MLGIELNNRYIVFSPKTYLDQVKMIIVLRWFSIFGVILLIVAGKFIFEINFNPIPIIVINLMLILLNLFYMNRIKKISKKKMYEKQELGLSKELIVDHILLTCILAFVGGITNPFSTIYIYDTLITAILLSRNHCIFHTLVSTLLITILSLLQYFDLVCLRCEVFMPNPESKGKTIFLTWFALIFSITVVAAITTYLMEKYRNKVEDLNKLNKILQESQEEKAQFYRIAAHELKAPVSGIRTLIQTARYMYGKDIPQKADTFFVKAEKRADLVLNRVKDLLVLSKDKSLSDLDLKVNNIKDLLEDILHEEEHKFNGKSIQLIRSYQCKKYDILFDKDEMSKVFTNLITNGIRYSHNNTTMSVSIYSDYKFIYVSVKDQGIGIRAEDIPNIGKDFYRTIDAKQHSEDGTGLGMAITFSIVRKHKGDIIINSEHGKGSEFIVKLPYTH